MRMVAYQTLQGLVWMLDEDGYGPMVTRVGTMEPMLEDSICRTQHGSGHSMINLSGYELGSSVAMEDSL